MLYSSVYNLFVLIGRKAPFNHSLTFLFRIGNFDVIAYEGTLEDILTWNVVYGQSYTHIGDI